MVYAFPLYFPARYLLTPLEAQPKCPEPKHFRRPLLPSAPLSFHLFLTRQRPLLTGESYHNPLLLLRLRLTPRDHPSWEVGTFQTALLELNAPDIFLYNGSGTIPPNLTPDSLVSDIFASVDSVIANKPVGILPFFADEAVGDPAST